MHFFFSNASVGVSRIISAVETVGSCIAPLNLSNRLFAYETMPAESFSQTVIDISSNMMASPSQIAYDVSQHRSAQLSSINHDVQVVQGNSAEVMSDPLVSIQVGALAAQECFYENSQLCRHRIQLNIYTTGALFHEPNRSDASPAVLDSWVVGVKVNELDRLSSKTPIVRFSFKPFSSVSINFDVNVMPPVDINQNIARCRRRQQ